MAGDWIKLHRKMRESVVHGNPMLWYVWTNLLLEANWKRQQLRNGLVIESGEMIIGQEKFAAKVKISRQQLRTALSQLKKCKMLTSKSTNAGTHITIRNWGKYQGLDDNDESRQPADQPTANQPSTNHQPTANQPLTIEEESKESKEGEEGKNSPALCQILTRIENLEVSKEIANRLETWILSINAAGKFNPIANQFEMSRLVGLGWSDEKVVRSIEKSIGAAYPVFYDPDESRNGQKNKYQDVKIPDNF